VSASAEQLLAALGGPVLTLATLPPARDCPVELTRGVEHFDAGDGAAARASAGWLRESALHEHGSARTYVWLGGDRLHGFFAISVGTAKLEDEELVRFPILGYRHLPTGDAPLPLADGEVDVAGGRAAPRRRGWRPRGRPAEAPRPLARIISRFLLSSARAKRAYADP